MTDRIRTVYIGDGMSWIKMTVAGAALCAVTSVAEAQGPPAGAPSQGQGMGSGQMRGGRMHAMLFKGISLTAAQEAQIAAISDKGAKERRDHMPAGGTGGPPDPAMRKMMTEMQEKLHAEIRAVLTGEQQKIFDTNVAAMKARREQRMAAPRAG
ncbi:MAG: hypothetical protein ABIR58_05400 [Gemmatimonadaceae bacterium]